MAYILLAALIFAVGWGLKSAMSIPHPDGLTVILSSTVVLTGALFWVVVTLHALDLLVAFNRVANGLLKHQVMDKASILTNLEALIADPTPTRDTVCLLAACWQPLPTPLYHMQLASTSLAECA